MAKWTLPDAELQHLDKLAVTTIVYLVAVGGVSLFAAFYVFWSGLQVPMLGVALVGLAGSAVAALTSCLDRYATGFEREDGTSYPADAKDKQKFNRRMSRWFITRPFLGLVVAPILVWGIEFFVADPDRFRSSSQHLGFTGFMAGLLAKSVLDLIKGLFKNVFHT
jgi:L-lactate permease